MNEVGAPPSEILGGDHRELDRLFEEFQATPPAHVGRRHELFGRFATGLRRHIEVEERRLFPPFAEADPSHRLLVGLMLDEHRRIEDVLGRIQGRLDEGPASTEELDVELVNVLWAHNVREEEAVYPWFDQHLSVEAAKRVARELSGTAAPEPPP